MPIRRTRRTLRKPVRRSGRKLKQSFSTYGLDRLATAAKRGAFGRPFGGRRKGWIAQDKAMIGNYSGTGGDYSQFTEARMKSGIKKRTTLPSLVKEVRQKAETTLFRYGGFGLGPGANGFFWCNKQQDLNNPYDFMPLYMYDLTAVNNMVNNVQTLAQPFYRAKSAAGNGSFYWDAVSGLHANGTPFSYLVNEKSTSASTSATLPHLKSRLLWTDVRLNLYGAKTKAIKWTIQVVKLNEDFLDPLDAAKYSSPSYGYQKMNACWQSLLKPSMYNPLALTGPGQTRGIKVLKTFTTIIQPTSTTESDANPHTKILKWFMRWDRDINYQQTAQFLPGPSLTGDEDYVEDINQASPYTKNKSKIWLMIRCTDYSQSQSENTNTIHGSFDMTIRANHVPC